MTSNSKRPSSFIGPNFNLLDAAAKESGLIKKEGTNTHKYASIVIETKSVKDSALIYLSRSFVTPDTIGAVKSNLVLDHTGYWTVQGLSLGNIKGTVSFEYENYRFYGNEFIQDAVKKGILDSIILVYRKGPGNDWVEIPFEAIHDSTSGKFISSKIEAGEYCLALKK